MQQDIQSSQRSRLIRKNIILSFVIKGWSALVVLMMVPLTLKMLGIYNNGVWLTISSVLIWIDLMDIGLGNGLRNTVAHYVALGDDTKVREAVSSTFFMLAVIVTPLLLLFYSFIWLFDAYGSLGVNAQMVDNLNTVLTIAVTLASGTFILKATGNFYMGLQLPAVNNLIVCIGQTLILLVMFIAYIVGCRSLLAVAIISTATPLCTWALSIPYTFLVRYPQYRPSVRHINLTMSKSLCSMGIQFFVLQICGVILFMSTNIIISRLFSPAEVTPYQIAYRYFNLVLVLFTTICMPFWNATTDAYTRGDTDWIHRMARKLNFLMAGCALLLTVMVLCSNIVYRLWVGSEIHIPIDLSAGIALYIFIIVFSQRYSFILNGLNILRIQLYFTVLATVAFLPLALIVCRNYATVTSLTLVMCLVNVPGLIANIWKYRQVMKKM